MEELLLAELYYEVLYPAWPDTEAPFLSFGHRVLIRNDETPWDERRSPEPQPVPVIRE